MESKLTINRSINTPLEFKGLKAQYIGFLGAGLLLLLLLFAVLYIAGVSGYLLLIIVTAAGFLLSSTIFKYSHKYGQHGLMKKAAYRRLPKSINGKRVYRQLHNNNLNP